MRFLGIDVGVHGAIGVVGTSRFSDVFVATEVYDMPTIPVVKTVRRTVKDRQPGEPKTRTKEQKRNVYDVQGVWTLLRRLSVGGVKLAVLEDQWAFQGQGVSSALVLGRGLGYLEMALMAAGIPTVVKPSRVWKKAMGLSAQKGASRVMAERMFPEVDLGKRADEGRSEALLMAVYAMREATAS